jgi:hypothetical protein
MSGSESTLDVTVDVFSKMSTDASATLQDDQVDAFSELCKAMKLKVSEPDFCDCAIVCGGERLRANKYILCLRSDVFRVSR